MNDLFRFMLLRPPGATATVAITPSETLKSVIEAGGSGQGPVGPPTPQGAAGPIADPVKGFLASPSATQTTNALSFAKHSDRLLQRLSVRTDWSRSQIAETVTEIFGTPPAELIAASEYATEVIKVHDTLIAAKLVSDSRSVDVAGLVRFARAAAVISIAADEVGPTDISDALKAALHRNFSIPASVFSVRNPKIEPPSGRSGEDIASEIAKKEKERNNVEAKARSYEAAIAEISSLRAADYELTSRSKISSERVPVDDKSGFGGGGGEVSVVSISYESPPRLRLTGAAMERLSKNTKQLLATYGADAHNSVAELARRFRGAAKTRQDGDRHD